MSSNSCCRRTELRPSPRGWRRLLGGLLLGCMLISGPSNAASWRDDLPQAQALGEGEMRWFGLRIYHATLWAEQRPFQPERPFALQLRYHRNIGRQRLVQTSVDEIRRLDRTGIDAGVLARWEQTLGGAFTDVAPGDELIAVYAPARGMRLYNQQRWLADINDPQLARAFFGIWLDADTRDQDLRRKLLGGPP
jgi:hypothetical protein